MDKIWLKHYPPGIAHDVDTSAYRSLLDVFEQSCTRFRDKPAFTSMGTTLTYGEVERLTNDFAAYLQHACGLQPGDRLAIMMPNLLQYPIAVFGAFRAGLVVVNCNPLYTARELRHQLEDSGAKAILVLENFAHTVQEVGRSATLPIVMTTEIGDLFPPIKALLTNLVVKYAKKMVPEWHIEGAIPLRAALAAGRKHTPLPVTLQPDDLAFLQYTGGTTGVPKGAMLTHGNMVANLQQISVWVGSSFVAGEEVVVTPLPLYHIFALTVNLLTFVKWGGHNVLIANPRDLPSVIKDLKETPLTVITGVNTLFKALLNHPGFSDIQTARLKFAFGGGMPVQRAVAEEWQSRTGKPLIEGYGLTEASPIVTGNPVEGSYTGSIGLPLPSTDVSIRDDQGAELPLGETGELCVQGPQVMRGYWQHPEETANVFTPDHWLRTGDMGHMDERGYIRITDRKKDMIVVSGFKVFPNEVEEVVMSHPGVLEAACIGVPDARTGHAVMIVAVRSDPTLDAAELVAYCRKHLTGYKVPKQVRWREEPLPKTPVGKILRRVVRDEVEKELAAA